MTIFTAQRVTHTATIYLAAPPDLTFPLFTPLGEKNWVIGWDPEIVYPPSGATEPYAVFTTHHHNGARVVWTIATFAPADRHIAYVRVEPESLVAVVDVRCTAGNEGTTSASVIYTYTGLSEDGNAYIRTLTENEYRSRMASWEEAINHYLQHGHALQH